ncbi:hypothetical protein A607_0023 [Helicobacter pylori UMB_G1]|nr:hypothetical protein A607_0023 [Helicobacter pylori UMB_G1]
MKNCFNILNYCKMLKLKLKVLTILLDKKLLFIGIDEYF